MLSFCVDFSIRYTTRLSHNCLYGCPRVVSGPIQMFIALFSPAVWGLCSTQRIPLSASGWSGYSCRFSFFVVVTIFVLFAQWKDRLKVDLVEAQPKAVKETGCFHITQDIPLIFFFFFSTSGTCLFKACQSRVLNKFTTAHCFLICLQHQPNSWWLHNTL